MKNISNKTLIFYTFQLQKQAEYNVIVLHAANPAIPTIKDAILSMPFDLSAGRYHFRFRTQFMEGDQKIVGWIDINNFNAKVPVIGGSVYIKILTLKDASHNKLFHLDKLKKADIITHSTQTIITHQNGNIQNKQTSHQQPKHTSLSPGHTIDIKSVQSKVSQHTVATKGCQVNLIQIKAKLVQQPQHQSQKIKSPPKPPLYQVSSKSVYQVPQTHSGDLDNFIVFDTPKPLSSYSQQNLQTFKNQLKDQQQHIQNQLTAKQQLQQQIMSWGYADGKINNTPTILATLHQVWPEWETVSLVQMLKIQQVSLIFKKAAIKLHPDKNRDKHFKLRYLSKRLFQLLHESRRL